MERQSNNNIQFIQQSAPQVLQQNQTPAVSGNLQNSMSSPFPYAVLLPPATLNISVPMEESLTNLPFIFLEHMYNIDDPFELPQDDNGPIENMLQYYYENPILVNDAITRTFELVIRTFEPVIRTFEPVIRTFENITHELLQINKPSKCSDFTCAICFETTPVGGVVFTTKCGHSFCISCVAQWVLTILQSRIGARKVDCSCAMCRQVFISL